MSAQILYIKASSPLPVLLMHYVDFLVRYSPRLWPTNVGVICEGNVNLITL